MALGTVVVAQIIEAEWRKHARGGALASLRSRIPEGLPLPASVFEVVAPCVLHLVTYDGRNLFAAPTTEDVQEQSSLPVVLSDCVGLHPHNDDLRVVFEGSYMLDSEPGTLFGYANMGAPRRTIPHEPFRLKAGEWGQIRYVGRFSYESYWAYRKYTYNIGWLTEPTRQVFLHTQPTRRFASVPNLR